MTDITLSGHCLCGTVRYQVTGTLFRFFHCHCERCRRASGTGHASNIILNPAGIDWQSGKSSIKRYKVPEADRFATAFCTNCGGPVAREHGELIVFPAGTLDTHFERTADARIFWGSRAPWSCEAGSVPAFSEYPTA